MNAQPGFTASNLLVSVAAFIVIVAGMKAAASLLVPFLLAVFIAILIASPFSWLQDKGLPAGVALLAVLGLLVFGLLLVGTKMPVMFTARLDATLQIWRMLLKVAGE